MKVDILEPSGCCAGVNRAILMAINARKENPSLPIYVLGMLVHNESVISNLDELNIVTLKNDSLYDALNNINDGVVIFTAHGHDENLDKIAKEKGLIIYDTTCGFVKYNHNLIKDALNNGHQVIFIGKLGHPETEASLSISKDVLLYDINSGIDYDKITDSSPIVICQTTLSIFEVEEIKNDILNHLKDAKITQSICSATTDRQTALKEINQSSDLIIIVGSKMSSNSSKLFDIARKLYPTKTIIQIKTVNELVNSNLSSYKFATIVGGASTPSDILLKIKEYLESI
ncbi:MAG: 4-hydroxy-3-methylbut-2-enyl diphosphate reductase [Erysipelotrichales bacterium]|nr:4-hydroxy-3-methylbut-2-enyl diphosphate reductase [Erysipelotrichales bacterium]